MPGMNGFEVMEKLARSKTRLPLVVITGHDTPEARARASRAQAYLLKPIDDQTLIKAIEDAISIQGA